MAAAHSETRSPVDPITGMPLPLLSTERILPLADGKCNIVTTLSDLRTRSDLSWVGACPFGLANGPGYWAYGQGRYAYASMLYGANPVQYRANNKVADWARTYRSDLSMQPQFEEVIFKTGNGFVPSDYSKSGPATHYRSFNANSYIAYFYTAAHIKCPEKNWPNPAQYFPDAPQIKDAAALEKPVKKMCGYKDSKTKLGLSGEPLYIIKREETFDMVNGQWVPRGLPVEVIRLCKKEREGQPVDCTDAINELIAQQLPQINAVIEADKTAEARAIAEITARYAPLETAAKAKIVTLFANGDGQ